MPNTTYVPSVGQAGGIVLMWKDGFCLEIVNSSSSMFHALVTNDPARGKWFLSCVYGTPYRENQTAQWEYIKNLSKLVKIPWVLIGDLNITFDMSERNTNTNSTSDEVIDLIREAELLDLGYSGNPFTWTSNSHGTGRIKSRLDRSLVNNDCLITFPDSKLLHLPIKGSDHAPILLSLYTNFADSNKTWKFFEHWLQNDTCVNEIKNAWVSNTAGFAAYIMSDKFSNTRHILSLWSKNIFGNIQGRITALQQQLEQLQHTDVRGMHTEKVLNIEKEIDSLNEVQASSYIQKSKDHYYNDLDKNTKYFHFTANQRRVRNKIDSLQVVDGTWCQDKKFYRRTSCLTVYG
ncbi:uncharacterized protein LOC113291769 [Papaver somniferum]|uniref:uncharacterized protein LOC113291769 n=1 Tax=Papaver somniferum TaxID=3469 RepID=UPI000E6FFFF4|nr:uncharacterized protein LOC113291769 [Papaver somniferum]